MSPRKSSENPASALPVCPIYVERFHRSPAVRRMGGFERGVYVLLLLEEWSMQGGGLPSADWQLAGLVNLAPDEWATVRSAVLPCFDCGDPKRGQDPERLYQATCEESIALALSQRDAARRNGRRGGRPAAKELAR